MSRAEARIHEATPDGRWKILTILGAVSARGMIATMTIEATTDREIFLAYLDEVLCPKLRPGDVVVMDNLSSHKVSGLRERIEAAGARLLYLPPYSPELTPSRRPGQSLNNWYARPWRGPKRPSIRPSPNCSHCSPPRTQELGSGSRLMLYCNSRNALVIWVMVHGPLRGSFTIPFPESVIPSVMPSEYVGDT